MLTDLDHVMLQHWFDSKHVVEREMQGVEENLARSLDPAQKRAIKLQLRREGRGGIKPWRRNQRTILNDLRAFHTTWFQDEFDPELADFHDACETAERELFC